MRVNRRLAASITQMSSCPPRSDSNATDRPSGDTAGCRSVNASVVSRTGAVVPGATYHSSRWLMNASAPPRADTSSASRSPSGEAARWAVMAFTAATRGRSPLT